MGGSNAVENLQEPQNQMQIITQTSKKRTGKPLGRRRVRGTSCFAVIRCCGQPLTGFLDPSLTDRSIQKLTILSQGNLTPSHEVVQTWAELLEARAEDVVAWLLDQHHETNGGQSWLPHHLPTPTSTSPEPFGEYQESLKVESPYSPILPSSLPRTHQVKDMLDLVPQANLVHHSSPLSISYHRTSF